MSVNASQLIRWQTQMSNSAHQREVADLQAAGLNPVLSAKFGGASTPSGAMDAGSGGSGGSRGGSGSAPETEGDSLLGQIINNLPNNGNLKLGKFSIPYSLIKTLYDYGSKNWDSITQQIGNYIGVNLSELNLKNALVNVTRLDDNGVDINSGLNPEDPMTVLGGKHNMYREETYRPYSREDNSAKQVYGQDSFEKGLYKLNPRLLYMYYHITGQDWKNRYIEKSTMKG